LFLIAAMLGLILSARPEPARAQSEPDTPWEDLVAAPDPWTPSFTPQGVDSTTTFLVRPVYYVPYDRVPRPTAVPALKHLVLFSQKFFREQMSLWGYSNRTFRFEQDADGTPKIFVIQEVDANYPAAWFPNIFAAALNRLAAYDYGDSASPSEQTFYPLQTHRDGFVYWLFSDLHQMNPLGGIERHGNGGAGNGDGAGGGVGVTTAFPLAFANPGFPLLPETTPYEGTTELTFGGALATLGPYTPGPGPYAMSMCPFGSPPCLLGTKTAAWFDGHRIQHLSSTLIGGPIHELEHGLGIRHDFGAEVFSFLNGLWDLVAGNLMGNGFRGIMGYARPDVHAPNTTRLAFSEVLQLSTSRFFAPDQGYADNTRPIISNVIPTLSTTSRLLTVQFDAQDQGSGLGCALLLRVPQFEEVVGARPLSGSEVIGDKFEVYDYRVGQNTFRLIAYDVAGNASLRYQFEFTDPGGVMPPVPRLFASRHRAKTGDAITFDASLTAWSTGSPSYTWDVDGDGDFQDTTFTGPILQWSYSLPGTYRVRVRVTAGAREATSPPLAVRISPAPGVPLLVIKSEDDQVLAQVGQSGDLFTLGGFIPLEHQMGPRGGTLVFTARNATSELVGAVSAATPANPWCGGDVVVRGDGEPWRSPTWEPGDLLILRNGDGQAIASLRANGDLELTGDIYEYDP